MTPINVYRYTHEDLWEGWIEPEDKSWILFFPDPSNPEHGRVMLYANRDDQGGCRDRGYPWLFDQAATYVVLDGEEHELARLVPHEGSFEGAVAHVHVAATEAGIGAPTREQMIEALASALETRAEKLRRLIT